jgi:hypothetical protein
LLPLAARLQLDRVAHRGGLIGRTTARIAFRADQLSEQAPKHSDSLHLESCEAVAPVAGMTMVRVEVCPIAAIAVNHGLIGRHGSQMHGITNRTRPDITRRPLPYVRA